MPADRRRFPAALRFRLPDDQLAAVEAAASEAGTTPSAWLRATIARSLRDADPATDRQLIEELVRLRADIGKFGNNLNQIARHLNSGGDAPDGLAERLESSLTKMRARVQQVLNERRT